MTTPPPSIGEVPYDNAEALEEWIGLNANRVTPLAAERLLAHYGFHSVAEMPTATAVRCAVWRPAKAAEHPALAPFQVLVYHTETLNRASVGSILTVIRRFRAWKLRSNADV